MRAIDVREPSLEDAFLGATGREFEDDHREDRGPQLDGGVVTARPGSAPTAGTTEIRSRGADSRLVMATIRVFLLRFASNPILLIRAPLTPVLILIGFHLAYQVSGQQQVGDQSAMGFLVIGMLGTGAWSSTVWGSGNAIQTEVYEGTISSVIAAPGRISAVITGQGLAASSSGFPRVVVSIVVGLAFGARLPRSSHPLAAARQPVRRLPVLPVHRAGVRRVCSCSPASRTRCRTSCRRRSTCSPASSSRVSALPEWLQKVSDLLPVSHAIDALRASTLSGASLSDVSRSLARPPPTSVLFLAAGLWGLHRLDDVVRRRGTLDLM